MPKGAQELLGPVLQSKPRQRCPMSRSLMVPKGMPVSRLHGAAFGGDKHPWMRLKSAELLAELTRSELTT